MTPRRLALTALGLMVLSGCGPVPSGPSAVAPIGPAPVVVATPPPTPSIRATPAAAACPRPATSPILAAPGVGKTVALTFDDGPSRFTPQILAILEKYGVHATFFDTGQHDARFPTYARETVAAGNVLGNHTYRHLKNWGFGQYFSARTERRELIRTSAVQTALLGHAPCLMRPPGGAYDAQSLALTRSLGMSMVLWSTGTDDWRQPPYLSLAFQQQIIANAEAGAALQHPIVLMHAGKASHEPGCAPDGCGPGAVTSFRGNTVAALPTVIAFYRAHGYRFVTL